ncbi:MAG: S8 family serine peptidase [Candidatus Kapabacteria bacterium]|nr:S8 family serine peptidase [Candidatus Kapabacteria bacterium]
MKRYIKSVIIFCFIISNFANSADSYIVKFKTTQRIQQIEKTHNIEFKAIFPQTKQLINSSKLQSIQYQINELNKYYVVKNSNEISKIATDNDIEFIEPNYIYHIEKIYTPNDSLFSEQWALQAINAQQAWQEATGKGIIIGFVDTGIDFTQSDLINQLAINSREDINHNGIFEPWSVNEVRNGITGDLNGIDDDGNGYIDDVIGFDFVDENTAYFGDWSNPDPIPEDEFGHGTSVAGVMAAEGNNKIGIIGLAYNSKILTARAFDIGGAGEADDIAQSILYLVLNGAKIINCSFGDYFKSQLVEDAINFAEQLGCIIVASSGNEGRSDPHFPSDYDGVISVGGLNQNGTVWSGSNFGTNLALIAPAINILTSDVNNNYSIVSGTSFAAPYVSAAIALLLEKDPSLNANEIRSLLITTAQKLNPNGWDLRQGAGILNVANALNYVGKSSVEMIYPKQFEIMDKSKNNQIPIIANVVTPLFDSYQFQISKDEGKQFEDTQISGNKTVLNDTLGLLDISQLQDTTYIISLKVNLKNGQFIRINKLIQIISSDSKNKIENFKTTSAYKNGKKIQIVAATTTYQAKFWVEIQRADDPQLHFRVDQITNNSTTHYLELENIITKGNYTGTAFTTTSNNDTVKFYFNFYFQPSSFSQYNYIEKPYSLKRGYLFNTVNNYYDSTQPSIIINDLSNFDIGKTEIYNFVNNKFILKDTIDYGWIPVKIGKSPIDNTPALLSKISGQSIITTSQNGRGNPYANVIFLSNPMETLWGDNLYDLDKDGKDELIAYNNANFLVYKYLNGAYQSISLFQRPNLSKGFEVSRGSVVGDFDGDGEIEVLIPDAYGRFAIYQYHNNATQDISVAEYIDTTIYNLTGQGLYAAGIDLEGNGKLSIIIGAINTVQLFNGMNNSAPPIWTFRLIQSDGFNSYKTTWQENFLGVREIDGQLRMVFRNGVTTANLDKDPGDELCISTFPNFMAMKWDKEYSTFKPVWLYPYAFTNSAIIYDFDKNGTKDIGVATIDSTRFFELDEYTAKPDKPIINTSYSIDENNILIKWNYIPNAKLYNIYEVKFKSDGSSVLTLIAQTQADSIIISNLSPHLYYYYIITAIDSSSKINESDFSELCEVYTHSPIKPISLKVISNNSIIINFNGKLKNNLNDNSICNIIDLSNNTFIFPNSLQVASDTTLIIILQYPLLQGDYQLNIASFKDYYGSPSIANFLDFEITEQPKKDELFLTSLKVLSPTLIILNFNDYIDRTTAENPNNYIMKPYGNVVIASRNDPDSNAVMLRLSEDLRDRDLAGVEYSITAKNIFSIDSKKITDGPGNTLSFVLTKPNLSSIFAFPNPVSYSNDDAISFGNLTSQAQITIMDLNGKELITLQETDANGGMQWNLRDKSGNKLPRGIYLYKITGKNSDGVDVLWEMNKFAIIP